MDRSLMLLLCALTLLLCATPARADEAEASATSDLPPPFEVALEAELRYAAADSGAATSDALVSRFAARWLMMPLLELRLDWGLAHVTTTRTGSHLGDPLEAESSHTVFGNPSIAVGLFLTDTQRPFAAHGITVEVLAGISLPVSPLPDPAMDARCLDCNLPALADGAQRHWTWMPMTLAAYTTMAIRRGLPDSWFFGADGSVAGMLRALGEETADTAWSLEGGLEGGWSFGSWLALGARLQGMFTSDDYDLEAVGSVVPFVELELFERGFLRVDATLDLWSSQSAPWAVGLRGGFAF